MTYKQLIIKLEKEVTRLYDTRKKCDEGGNPEHERVAYGQQMGLLYAIDQLKNKKDIK